MIVYSLQFLCKLYYDVTSSLMFLCNLACVSISRHFRAAVEAPFWIVCICHVKW